MLLILHPTAAIVRRSANEAAAAAPDTVDQGANGDCRGISARHVLGAIICLCAVACSGAYAAAEPGTPLPVAGSVLWLDASDAASVVADVHGLSRWRDRSGSNHDVAQPDPACRPTVSAARLNGRGVITFDGESQFLAGPAVLPLGQQAYTFVVVWRSRTNDGVQSIVEQSSKLLTGNTRGALLAVGAAYGFNGESNDRHDLVPFAADVWRLTCLEIDNHNPQNVRVEDNGKVYSGASRDPGSLRLGAGGLSIGRKLAVDGEYLDGDIAEIIVYPRVLAQVKRGETLDYLRHKWDLKPGSQPDFAVNVSTSVLYDETYRPQFHFSPRTNWTNDPNGLVYYQGEYHLFFQHNPTGINWGNMTWGHAVSPDLAHWKQLDDAIRPDRLGTIFSGSAAVDWENTTGFQTGTEKPIVAIYTAAGGTSEESKGQEFSQCIAYSNDRGRTWTKYEKNPVLPHIIGGNRDPKVIWYAPARRWILALFLDKEEYALFTSPDMKTWTKLQSLPPFGCGECPDFFPMAVDGHPKELKWVFTGANGHYLVGSFDGKQFTPDSLQAQAADSGRNYYAVQTYSDIPPKDGRRIQIAWMAGGQYPGMPFNQQMSFPCEMKLRRFPEGLRICRTPVKEIELLHEKRHEWRNLSVKPGENPLADIHGDLFDIRLEVEPGAATAFGLDIRGKKLTYRVAQKKLLCLGSSADLALEGRRISLQILVDRTSIEVYANSGRTAMTSCFLPNPDDRSLAFFTIGGTAHVSRMQVFELRSAWRPAGSTGK